MWGISGEGASRLGVEYVIVNSTTSKKRMWEGTVAIQVCLMGFALKRESSAGSRSTWLER
jgi:hypothetical protein